MDKYTSKKPATNNPVRDTTLYYGPRNIKCAPGRGCSAQATDTNMELFGLNGNQGDRQDAWYKKAAVIKNGGKQVWKAGQKLNVNNLRIGDYVDLDRPGSPHANDKSPIPGYSLKDNSGVEHVGVYVGVDPKTRRPLIKHGSASGTSVVQDIDSLSLSEYGFKYTPRSIYRSKDVTNKRLVNTTNYVKPTAPRYLSVPKNATENEKKYIQATNKNAESQMRMLGLSAQRVNLLNKIGYGIFHNESEAGNSLTPIGLKMFAAKAAAPFRGVSASLGDVQFKYGDNYKDADGSVSRVGRNMDKLSVNRDGLASVGGHRKDYNDEVNAVTSLLAVRLAQINKNKAKYQYDEKAQTVYGNVPIEDALIAAYKNPNALSSRDRILRLNKYVDNAKRFYAKGNNRFSNGGQIAGTRLNILLYI